MVEGWAGVAPGRGGFKRGIGIDGRVPGGKGEFSVPGGIRLPWVMFGAVPGVGGAGLG